MKKQITMPRLRPEMKAGILCAWTVSPGDAVRAGDCLFEVETDKVVSQIEAVEDGVISQFLAEEGDEVAVGAPVALLETRP